MNQPISLSRKIIGYVVVSAKLYPLIMFRAMKRVVRMKNTSVRDAINFYLLVDTVQTAEINMQNLPMYVYQIEYRFQGLIFSRDIEATSKAHALHRLKDDHGILESQVVNIYQEE
jgi:hypothetical protein